MTVNKKKSLFLTFAVIMVVLLAVGAGAVFKIYGQARGYLTTPEPVLDRPHLIEIKRGMSFKHITLLLEKERVISNPLYFQAAARWLGVTTQMKAGDYIFHPGLTPLQVLDMIIHGEITRVQLLVPEGWTIRDIARRISTLGPWTEEGFLAAATDPDLAREMGCPLDTLEGYLFPAMYYLKMSMTEETIVRIMALRGVEERTREREEKAKALGLSWHEVLSMAAMIEKEAMARGEMPTIAAVFHKRLKLKMPLQSDPTAIYGFKEMKDGITGRDLKRQSPYNTYLITGLPVGPICNPGLDAILAVLNPADTGYLYFVATGNGRHMFAKTYQEHLSNVSLYRRNLRVKREEAEAETAVEEVAGPSASEYVPGEDTPPAMVAPDPAP